MKWPEVDKQVLKEFLELFEADPQGSHHWLGRLIANVFATVATVAIKRRLDWHNLDLLAQIYEAEFAGHKYGQQLEDPKTHHKFVITGVYPPTLGDLGTWFMSDIIPTASKQLKQHQSRTFLAATLTILAAKGRE